MDINSPIARENADLRLVAEPRTGGPGDIRTVERDAVAPEPTALDDLLTPAPPVVAGPIRVHGKFFFAGGTKHFIKGVTYGPFAAGSDGSPFPKRAVVEHDFALMGSAGVNTVRVFTVPPVWLLDLAEAAGLKFLSASRGRSMSLFSTAPRSRPRSAPRSPQGCGPVFATRRFSPISSAMKSRPT